jgi:cell wall-associated NlpC family hydrolase
VASTSTNPCARLLDATRCQGARRERPKVPDQSLTHATDKSARSAVFSPIGATRATMGHMRRLVWLALFVWEAVFGAGCSSERPPPRTVPFLVSRAWARQEPPTTARAWTAVQFASAQVGRRYCWGGTGPACFDCSGLVQMAWGSAGVRLPRTADAIAAELPEISLEELRVGDILWWPGHVSLYAGSGWMVEALDARHGVVRRAARDPRRAFRPLGSS